MSDAEHLPLARSNCGPNSNSRCRLQEPVRNFALWEFEPQPPAERQERVNPHLLL